MSTETNSKYFSPYVYTDGSEDLVQIVQDAGLDALTLAFLQSSGDGTLGWGGAGDIQDDTSVQQQVKTLQNQGCQITISIGGAAGVDPATVPGITAAQLQAEYQSIIDHYGVTHLDFDIEGKAAGNRHSINVRERAIKGLEAANPDLHVSFTLAATPDGLDANASRILTVAAQNGIKLDTINIMAMDYFDTDAGRGTMGDCAISAARATEAQILKAGIDAKVGITPMIGRNDDPHETFTLADARKLESFAASTPWVQSLGMWSLGRDNGNGAGQAVASGDYSGIAQSPYQFASIFSQISSSNAGGRMSADATAHAMSSDDAGSRIGESLRVAPAATTVQPESAAGDWVRDFMTSGNDLGVASAALGTAAHFDVGPAIGMESGGLADAIMDGGDGHAFVSTTDSLWSATQGNGNTIAEALAGASPGHS